MKRIATVIVYHNLRNMEDTMTYRLTFNTCKELLQWGLLVALIPVFVGSALAASGHDDKSMGHQEMSGVFKHAMTMEGVKAEFQIMSLESMKMKDPDGATHHVMVKFIDADSDDQLKKAVGKIKVITPSKKEMVVDLKDYSGTFASNVTFDEAGKYGVICLVKIDGKKPLYKFWYSHQ